MSDQNELAKHKVNADVDADNSISVNHHAVSDQEIRAQQVSIKSWTQKILVVLLCMASFYGGWKSYESNAVNDCKVNGGQMIEGQKTMLCQLS